MNDCSPGTIPHLYSQQQLAGKTVNWIGTDQLKHFETNWQNSDTRERMIRNGWNHNTIIEYKFNQQCFRTDEFDNNPRIMILGCSITIGVGLHLNQTWPSCFSELTGLPIWNLATGSASIDTCYRVLKHYLPQLNITTVLLCDPGDDRFELWTKENGIDSVMSIVNPEQCSEFNIYNKNWFSSNENAKINHEKNLEAMHNICAKMGIKFLHFHRYDASKKYHLDDPDESRCLKQLGPKSQYLIAQYARDIVLNRS